MLGKNWVIGLFIMLILLAGVFFVNATNTDYDKITGGKHQIKQYRVLSNNGNEAEIVFDIVRTTEDKVNPKVEILSEKDPVYDRESQIIDSNLGKYRLSLIFTDTRLQQKLSTKTGRKINMLGNKNIDLLESIKVAYPPDDSLMVIYLGCSAKPDFTLEETNENIKIRLSKY